MNRRAFLVALLGLPVAAKIAPALKPTGNLFNPTANVAAQFEGVTMRIIRSYDASLEQYVSRIDALFGWGCPAPDMMFRDVDESAMQLRFDPARLPA